MLEFRFLGKLMISIASKGHFCGGVEEGSVAQWLLQLARGVTLH